MIQLNDGREFNPYRDRSEGVLSQREIDACRFYGIAIAYDPVQSGWVSSTCVDDINDVDESRHKAETLRQRFAAKLATLRETLSGRDKALASRQQALDLATAECLASIGNGDVELLEQSHITLHQDIARFFPSSWSRRQADNVDADIEFRPWCTEDAETYANIMGNERVWDYLPEPWPGAMTGESAASMISLANQGDHHKVQAVLVNGTIVGQVRLIFNQQAPGMKGAEVAYLLGEDFWGRGLMQQILREFSGRVLREHGLDYLVAWIRPDNVGSHRAATRAGYARVDCPWIDRAATRAGRAGFERYMLFERDLMAADARQVTEPNPSEAAA